MITCIVLYFILVFLFWAGRRGMLPEWCRGQTGKRMFLILFFSNTVAFGLFLMDLSGYRDEGKIQRNSYGKGKRTEEYQVTVENQLEKEPFQVEVGERKYTRQEIQKIFEKVMKELDQKILGENQSLDRVEHDMNFVTALEEYPIQIQWELDHYDVMNVHGEIQQEHTREEGTLVEIRGTLTYEEESALYVTNAVVYPERKNAKEQLLSKIQNLLEEEEEKTKEKEMLSLLKKVDGKEIKWSKKPDTRGYYVIVLGMMAAGLIVALEKQNEAKESQERREQMLTDYPEIMNKFTLLLSTGMTVKGVWERIVRNYEEQKEAMGIRAAYEEMSCTYYEMKGGISEAEAYERFGKRCGISAYIKFGALLSQNLRKGTKGITELLQMESVQAFENRKSRAKRLGEEASTKLLVPMFAMLAVVMVIVVVPTFLSIQL